MSNNNTLYCYHSFLRYYYYFFFSSLTIYLSILVFLFIYLSAHFYLVIYLSIYRPFSTFLSIFLSLSVFLFIYLYHHYYYFKLRVMMTSTTTMLPGQNLPESMLPKGRKAQSNHTTLVPVSICKHYPPTFSLHFSFKLLSASEDLCFIHLFTFILFFFH